MTLLRRAEESDRSQRREKMDVAALNNLSAPRWQPSDNANIELMHSGVGILRMPMEKESGSATEPRYFAFMGGLEAWRFAAQGQFP
jgi:hypothetical protein